MPSIQCGTGIRYPNFERGTAGCLVRFTDMPNHVLMMTAGHVVLPCYAKQNNVIYAVDLPGVPLGVLRTWTDFHDVPTADAALIWVDPTLITPDIVGLGTPTGFNPAPQIGDTLRITPAPGQATPRETNIEKVDSIEIPAPNWKTIINYQNQLICRPPRSEQAGPGDSGAIALDAQNRIAGMVVGGSQDGSLTYITPISAILSNSGWHGRQLELLTAIPAGAVAPTFPVAAPAPAAAGFGSLVPGGFFSDDPTDHSIARSIRTNNPGALNYTAWQKTRPGYVGKTESDGSAHNNQTTIYRTPEHGIASWFYLLFNKYSFGASGPFTILHLAQRYSGQGSGPYVDAYVAGWGRASRNTLAAATTIDLTVDQQVLTLGRAMFEHEAGKPSPLGDNQILFAVQHERDGTLQ